MSLSDYRYNPFTDVFTPYPIGYSGNPTEKHTVPSTSPFIISVNELPLKEIPSTFKVKLDGTSTYLVEVATSPATGQYQVIYGGDGVSVTGAVGQGYVLFNSADASVDLEFEYYGLGSILNKLTFDVFSPIGSIIAIHPNVKTAYLPDPSIWVRCDSAHAYGGGSATALSATYFTNGGDASAEGYVPNISGSRFLMGSTAYGVLDNNNQVNLLHSHSHSHGSSVMTAAFGMDANYIHTETRGITGQLWTLQNRKAAAGALDHPGSGTTPIGLRILGNTDVNAATALSATQSILPQYFTVLYYMRVK